MKLKWSQLYARWFYGCTKHPECQHSFDADQETGAPLADKKLIPEGHFRASDWTSGHPETRAKRPVRPGKALWRAILDESYLSGPTPVAVVAFPDPPEPPPQEPPVKKRRKNPAQDPFQGVDNSAPPQWAAAEMMPDLNAMLRLMIDAMGDRE
jgi:ssDNA-binding Zn-finger/Zn-ribbon topoisomerase 1